MKKIFKYTWPPAIIAIIIFYLCCLITPDEVPEIDGIPHMDKVVHFVMYFGLSLVASCNYILDKKGHIIILKLIVFAIAIPIIYGGIIEIVQSYYFNRTGDWFDFLADTLGSLASLPISFWFRRFLLNRQALL